MADVEPGEIVDQPSPTPPRLDRVGMPEGRDTTRFSNGAGGPRKNVTICPMLCPLMFNWQIIKNL